MKFDVIIGNPPYQDGKKNGGQNKIYNLICKRALDLLKPTGVCAFITPTSVLKYSKRFSLINQKGLKYVNFDANNYFSVGVEICYWIIEKTYHGQTSIISNKVEQFQLNDSAIYDFNKFDSNFAQLYYTLKNCTSKPNQRMFSQNNFGPALEKNKTEKHIFPLNKIENEKIKLTYWSCRKPFFEKNKKFSIAMTKSLNENSYYVGFENFDMGYLTINVQNDDEIENIKSFIFSNYFKEHCKKWKEFDGYGFNYGLKYLPKFDKTKKWNDLEVKSFFEFYNSSNLTQEEIDLIESTIK